MNTLPSLQAMSADVSVAAQLEPGHMADAARAGFRSIVNNRPDHEGGPEQPSSAEMEAAAHAAGLAYAHLPVSPSLQTEDDIARFAELLDRLPKPVLAFCRSGTRSGRLYRAASGL